MKITSKGLFSYFMLLILTFTLNVSASTLTESSKSYVRLPGHVPKQISTAKALIQPGVATDHPIPLTLVLPLRNQDQLNDFILRMNDPNDLEHFGKYLTTEQYIEKFAPTEEDYERIISYAEELGFTVTHKHANRLLLNVSGSAGLVESGFQLKLKSYMLKNGRYVFGPNQNPAVPVEIASIMKGIVGLDNVAVWRTYKKKGHSKEPIASHAGSKAFPSGPGGGFSPSDLVQAYNLSTVSADGTGQKIALFELASYQTSDIRAYTTYFGLPTPKLQNILVDGGSGEGIDAEVTLDIELAIALAPQSTILVYEGPNSDRGVLDTYNRIATDNLAQQVSTSWGLAEDLSTQSFLNAENAIFQQMAAQGQTIYAAAGDSGAYDDPNKSVPVVDDPASQPYIVGVGGTTLNVDSHSGTYVSESVWNNGFDNGAGGGGVSKVWRIPDWQKNIPNTYSQTYRNVPDVSLNADTNTGYAIYYNGQWEIYGGTSCAAPLWAAFTSLVNQERANTQQSSLGFANPIFYTIGVSDIALTAFNDVYTGNNLYYGAGRNYDNATGWGSFNGANLFATLVDPSQVPSPQPPSSQTPEFDLSMIPTTNFKKGKTCAYEIDVTNTGNESTSGKVTVQITLPPSLSYSSYSAAGWTFKKSTLTFTRSSTLDPGKSYSPIRLNVKVDKHAPSLVQSTATISGGGADSTSVTCSTVIQ